MTNDPKKEDHHFLTQHDPLVEAGEMGSMMKEPWHGDPYEIDGHPLTASGIGPRTPIVRRPIDTAGIRENRGPAPGRDPNVS